MTIDEEHREPLANALWFTDLPARDAVLVIEASGSQVGHVFKSHFSRFNALGWGDLGRTGMPYADGQTDLVVLECPTSEASSHEDDPGHYRHLDFVLMECRRLMKPGASLMILGPNPWWFRTIRRALRPPRTVGDLSMGRLEAALVRCRLTRIHGYYLTRSYHFPGSIIPANRRVTALRERLGPALSKNARLRSVFCSLGFYGLMHAGRMLLATK